MSVAPQPRPLTWVRVVPRNIQIRGAGLFEVLERETDDFIAGRMVSRDSYNTASGTPVKQIIADLRSSAKALSPSWRWKAFETLPLNLENQVEFIKECTLKKRHLRRLFDFIMSSVFPSQLGKENMRILCEWLVEEVFRNNPSEEYPRLKILGCDPLRAMRSAGFKEAAASKGQAVHEVQKLSSLFIASFVTDITLSLMLQFVQVVYPRFGIGPRVFYSKRGFNFWMKKEIRLFKEDYQLKCVKDPFPVASHLISKTKILAGGSTMRPICPFIKADNWTYANMMQMINVALDFHLCTVNGPRSLGVHAEIRRLKQFLSKHRQDHPNKRLFFMKSDVSKCFANLNRDILKQLLHDLIESRPVVVAYIVIMGHTGRMFRLMAAGVNREAAAASLEAKIRRKKLTEQQKQGHISYQDFLPRLVKFIMDSVDQLRFTIGGNKRKLFQMGKGVPQGCMLSSRLAHIYLLAYDKSILAPYINSGSRMFRYADDYLFVVDKKETAIGILDELQRPNNPLGLKFKKEKTMVSFNTPGYSRKGRTVVWCGASIDTKKNVVLAQPRRKATSLVLQQHTIQRLATEERIKHRRMWRKYENDATE